eukprot:12890154-Ditylum_brightwellii.AAC.2
MWPDAVKEKDQYFRTPLHIACSFGHSEAVTALLKVWPDAVKEKNDDGDTPLHNACLYSKSLEIVAALLKIWPDAVKETDCIGFTPLCWACINAARLEVVTLLLNEWLSYKENTTNSAIMSLETRTSGCTEDVKVLLSHLFALCNISTNDTCPPPKEIMDYFIHIQLWNGVTLVLDRHNPTALIQTMGLDTKVMADFLSTVGRHCSLTTIWEIIRNEQDLLEGV